MQLEAKWRAVGIITGKRELKSPKNAAWRGYIVQLASLGLCLEVEVTPELFASIAEGEQVEASGRFESRQLGIKLIGQQFKAVK